jgi:AbrB family looped-hinge helix DNA binding protein
MRATGIVRRIDDIGRIVIPKEIRKSMNIQVGDPLELYTSQDMVCFKKYKAYEPNYELIFQVLAAVYDVAGVYDNNGVLQRVGAAYTLDTRIAVSLESVTLSNGLVYVPIVDDYKDTVAIIAVDDKYANQTETIQRLAQATFVAEGK